MSPFIGLDTMYYTAKIYKLLLLLTEMKSGTTVESSFCENVTVPVVSYLIDNCYTES